MTSLKSFIKSVRAAKTLAEERSVIQKESAAIRTSFRENYVDPNIRKQNVAKLLYLFTLGERTHFGQVECLKLIASPRFSEKRLGYLGTMLLLDENQETLTLVTNSLSNDLNHPNQYVVALALTTLANIASTEMGRDLFQTVDKIMSSSNPYLKKKAAVCAARISSRVPELAEIFVEKAKILLTDKNHGVLLCGLTLATDICVQDDEILEQFRPVVPTLVKLLRQLCTSAYAPEHDVTGVTDPFLQVKILGLLRVLGAGDASASDAMNDVLAQVASNTDSAKNVGSSVLYECVRTIFAVEADTGLRVLGVNILGKFLATTDNNTRYVALNTLLTVIDIEPAAVQRHRNTIVECLRDADVSIRRRALAVAYALINESNVRVIVRELLTFLESADAEFKPSVTAQIAIAAEKYAPNKRWHIDTLVRALALAGSHVPENVVSSFIALVVTCDEELQLYTVQKLYSALRADFTQEGLSLASLWLLGEFGHILIRSGNFSSEEGESQEVSEESVVTMIENLLKSAYASDVVQEYGVNALVKLSTRINDGTQKERVRRILESYASSLNVEVQQRSAEYTKLFSNMGVAKGVLEKMPAPELKNDLGKKYAKPKKAKKVTASKKDVDLLLDLVMDAPAPTNGGSGAPAAAANNSDLLADILGPSSPSGGASGATPSSNQNIMDLFGSGAQSSPISTPASAPAAASTISAYSGNGLSLGFSAGPAQGLTVPITAHFTNDGGSPISSISLQAAVPKTQKLALQPPASQSIGPGSTTTQQLRVTVQGAGAAVKLRVRLGFSVNGQQVQEQFTFDKFGQVV